MMSGPNRKAKKGDLFAYPITHSITNLNGSREIYKTYGVGVVKSVDDNGYLKSWVPFENGSESIQRKIPLETFIVSQDRLDMAKLKSAWIKREDKWFNNLDDGREFLRTFLVN